MLVGEADAQWGHTSIGASNLTKQSQHDLLVGNLHDTLYSPCLRSQYDLQSPSNALEGTRFASWWIMDMQAHSWPSLNYQHVNKYCLHGMSEQSCPCLVSRVDTYPPATFLPLHTHRQEEMLSVWREA